MSRSVGSGKDFDIDISKPGGLSVLDRAYLSDRGQLPKGAKPLTEKERAKLQKEADSEDQEPNDIVENDGAESDESEEGYDDWSNDELKDEARNRELSGFSSLNHDELVDMLEADDEEVEA